MRYLLFIFACLCCVGWGPFTTLPSASNTNNWLENETNYLMQQADNLNPKVLRLGLTAYLKARQQGLDAKQLLTIVDYTKPSTQRRLWVIDLKNSKILFNTWVTHGKNSGLVNATSFSNQFHSLKSSLGVFLTEQPYVGHEGYSLRIEGLEPGINDNAYDRDVVFHGAWYASPTVAKERGMLGRSWGCMAVGEDTVNPLINTIKDQTVVMAYYPDPHWLRNSAYLNYTEA